MQARARDFPLLIDFLARVPINYQGISFLLLDRTIVPGIFLIAIIKTGANVAKIIVLVAVWIIGGHG